ncbi:YdcF family protein [Flaviaesturariibacter flavus]|uniref:YdcF family protein n=1 Tax=Flaviaesturariibacter flavus TaxID=2502780 RepID=A0A4R1BBF9_9BACT|nr:YdcF family protein [Flaviaesturariibacter flavus]TCJ14313.1 YdcF family protein [Flaviaesturariibacter flavus]
MFILLKVLLWFFRPLVWIVILLVWARLTRRAHWKKRLYGAAIAALLFFSNPAIIRGLLSAYEPAPVPIEAVKPHSAGIVLGGFVAYNVRDGKGYFNSAGDRFIQTALLYKAGKIHKIIVPAGNGYIVQHGFSEAAFIRDHFVRLGIPATDIYLDSASRNTLENAQNTKRILDTAHLPGPYLLISSAAHLPRARRVFDKLQIPVELFPCDFVSRARSNNFVEDYLLPSSTALATWDGYLKELLGTMTYKLTGKG